MAGNYPDVPGHRLAWDRDGTILVRLDTNNNFLSEYTSKATYNSETIGTLLLEGWACFIFPQHMNIVGYTVRQNAAQSQAIMTSVDSTNGADGTWIDRGPWSNTSNSKAVLRDIIPVDWPGVKAVKFRGAYKSGSSASRHLANIHLYGALADPGLAAGLQIWHPVEDEQVGPAYFDWGDRKRSSSISRDFRVKNLSSTLTATDVLVSLEALTNSNPTLLSPTHQFAKSSNPGVYSATQTIDELEPGEVSEVLTVRYSVPTDAELSLWWARILAVPGDMS